MAYARPIHPARETGRQVYHNDRCARRDDMEQW
jgi:hypothetical protein